MQRARSWKRASDRRLSSSGSTFKKLLVAPHKVGKRPRRSNHGHPAFRYSFLGMQRRTVRGEINPDANLEQQFVDNALLASIHKPSCLQKKQGRDGIGMSHSANRIRASQTTEFGPIF